MEDPKSDPGPRPDAEGEKRKNPDALKSQEQLVTGLETLDKLKKDGVVKADASTIIFLSIDNRGGLFANGPATGVVGPGASGVQIDVTQGAAARSEQTSAEPVADIETWFDTGTDDRGRCLAIAIAFLPGASFTAILAASDRLYAQLLPAGEKPSEAGFGRSRAALLCDVRADLHNVPGEDGAHVEIVRFTDMGRYDLVRRYVWEERVTIRAALLGWLIELGRSADLRIALSVGTGIGACAAFAFDDMWDGAILPMARQPFAHSAITAGEALGVALRYAPDCKVRIVRHLRAWTGEGADRDDRSLAVLLCGSAFGASEIDAAMSVLHRAEWDDPVAQFDGVQKAIDLFWLWASLVPDVSEALVTGLTSGFDLWERGDRSSILCVLPMLHLGQALIAEIATLKAQQPDNPPLLLRSDFQRGLAFVAIAALLERGLKNRHSRRYVRAKLDSLIERAEELGKTADFWPLTDAMHRAAQDDDSRERILSYRDSWKASQTSKQRLA